MSLQPDRARALALAAVAMALLVVAPTALGQSSGPNPQPATVEGGPDTGQPTPTPPSTPPVGQYPPDLYPTGITVNATDETRTTEICVQISDIAPRSSSPTYTEVPAGAFTVRLDLYVWNGENWTLDRQPEARHTGQMSNTVNQRASVCFNLALRSSYYLVNTLVDSNNEVAESNEENNARPSYLQFAVEISPRAELRFEKLDVSPSPAASGRTIGFVALVRNDGERPSNATVVDVLDGTRLLSRLPIPSILVGQTISVQTAVLADTLRPGEHTARFVIDPIRNVTEYSRANNAADRSFFVLQHPEPDLIVQNLSYDGALVARRGLTLHARFQNVGNLTAGPTSARLYADGVPVQNASLAKLGPLELTQADFFIVPSEGNHTLRVVVDPDDLVAESNESNNEANLTVVIAPPATLNATANLVVERLDAAPNDPGPGEVVTITAIVQNLGDKTSPATTLDLTANGRTIGRAHVPPVTGERRVSVSYPWTPPPPGLYAIRAFVDPDGIVNETDKFDNNATLYTEILPPGSASLPVVNATLPGDDVNATPPVPPSTFLPPPTPTLNGTSSGPTAGKAIEITQLTLSTRQVPGGVKGIIIASLRNPTFAPIGRMTMTFRVDGASPPLKEILISGLASAATTTATSSDVDLPAGTHLVSAEVRIAGADGATANATKSYTADAGPKTVVPGVALAPFVLSLVAAAIVLRRRR